MSAAPLAPSKETSLSLAPRKASGLEADAPDWTHLVAAGTLLAGGVLIASGRRRAGVLVAAAGTALALVEEQETLAAWWKRMPGYLEDAQNFLDKVEGAMKEATAQGQKLQSLMRR